MNEKIKEDLYEDKLLECINIKLSESVKKNPKLITDNPILEIEYDIDGNKKDIYSLASERDIKNMQILSDKNELEFKHGSKKISDLEYKNEIEKINAIQKEQNLLYDDLIFNIINTTSIEDIKKSIICHNLNSIDLERLAKGVSSVAENKINEFKENNRKFMIDNISYWNYKYNKISKELSKAREVESFILNLAEEK